MARKGLEAPALKEKVKVPSRPKVTEGDWGQAALILQPIPEGVFNPGGLVLSPKYKAAPM